MLSASLKTGSALSLAICLWSANADAEAGSARSVHLLLSPVARTANCSVGYLAGLSFGPTYEDGGNAPASASADIAVAVPYQQSTSNLVDLVLALSVFFHPTPDLYVGPRGGIFSTLSSAPLPVFHGGLAVRYYFAPIFYAEASGGFSAAGNQFAIAQIGFAPF